MAATKKQIDGWIAETRRLMQAQPEDTWTVARLRLAYANPGSRSLVQVDTVAAAGACPAHATAVDFNRNLQRIEIAAEMRTFGLNGTSNVIGPFAITLQQGKRPVGRFRQVYADCLWPIHGSWTVPFVIETRLGRLIPRPSDEDVVLKSSEPGEYGIPPIGVWFEKWDPVNLVMEGDPDGPTVAICEHAMHCMLNVGKEPKIPPFCKH
jgi:hypothetical protein